LTHARVVADADRTGMVVAAAAGMPSPRRVRYAVVGLGHIAQAAVLPAFRHASNSILTAIVSDDPRKQRELARRYGVDHVFDYDGYDALPNAMHAEYTIRAAAAGVHVLCEKPLAHTVADCERMIAACRCSGVKLMTAYRLHFEELNLQAVDLVRKGRIGEPKFFTSAFGMTVRAGDIRTKRAMGGGTLFDIGVYCINAARYLFRAEPTEVVAATTHGGGRKLAEIDESTGAILRFGGDRVATFVTSFNSADVGAYRVVGTKGHIRLDPAYEYADGLAMEVTVNGRTRKRRVGKRDQFGPQLFYFSSCILRDRTPEPSGEDGLQDVRIVEALYRSARTGRSVRLPPFRDGKQPTGRQRIVRPGIRKPKLVKVQSASE
jgi:glucose-fructose oxidoreductase